ncbi:PAS domain-containing protein [Pelagibius sp.]|uniref:PAS domain-containing protein n=1 Tax=Pelagibius sp. TaxID=1931238 RepID=UPI00260B3940|nr:PAS domain-containing protein [Pelagibius sp.]
MNGSRPSAEITELPLRQLYDYWTAKRGGRPWPARADILPSEIPTVLPFVMLTDVLDGGAAGESGGGLQFRLRLVGTDVAFGIDPTGQLLHEAVPEGPYRDHITALFSRGAAGPGALYSRTRYNYAEITGPRTIARIFMPLAADGEAIDMMLIGQMRDRQIHADHSAWQANPPAIDEEFELRLP